MLTIQELKLKTLSQALIPESATARRAFRQHITQRRPSWEVWGETPLTYIPPGIDVPRNGAWQVEDIVQFKTDARQLRLVMFEDERFDPAGIMLEDVDIGESIGLILPLPKQELVEFVQSHVLWLQGQADIYNDRARTAGAILEVLS